MTFFYENYGIDPDLNMYSTGVIRCDYGLPDNIENYLIDGKFNITLLNIRSLPRNYDAFIEFMNPILSKLYFIILTETWFNEVNAVYTHFQVLMPQLPHKEERRRSFYLC